MAFFDLLCSGIFPDTNGEISLIWKIHQEMSLREKVIKFSDFSNFDRFSTLLKDTQRASCVHQKYNKSLFRILSLFLHEFQAAFVFLSSATLVPDQETGER